MWASRSSGWARLPLALALTPTLALALALSLSLALALALARPGAHSMARQRGVMRVALRTPPDGTLHRPRYVVQRDVQRPLTTLPHAHRWTGRDDVESRIAGDYTPIHYHW